MPSESGRTSPQWTDPLILVEGDVPDDDAAKEAPRRWRRWRPYVDLGVVATLVLVAAIIANEPRGRDSGQPAVTSAPTVPTVELAPTREPYPLLVAPAFAEIDETVSVVAYRRRDLCGAIELRLDGIRLEHHVTATIESPDPDWDAVVLTVRLQAPGGQDAHELQLFGPVSGRGRGGPRCGDGEQRWDRIATAAVVIGPPAG